MSNSSNSDSQASKAELSRWVVVYEYSTQNRIRLTLEIDERTPGDAMIVAKSWCEYNDHKLIALIPYQDGDGLGVKEG